MPFREQSDKLKAPSSSPMDENTKPSREDAPAATATAAAAAAAECGKALLYVPSGDQRLVLSAIDNQLNASKIAWKEKYYAADAASAPANNNNNNNNNNNSAKVEFFMKCMDQTGESLKRQLQSITTPANESDLERTLDSFHTRLFTITQQQQQQPGFDDDDDDSESSSPSDQEDESIDFDDNEILDRNAYDQVKQLRIQAREISARVISVREETAGRALDMTRRNLSELMSVHGFADEDAAEDHDGDAPNGEGKTTEDDDDDDGDEQQTKEKDGGSMETNGGAVSNHNMHIALQTLTTTLRHVDSNLTEKLESMKETIGTIDASVEKYQRLSQGDESVLSRTEKALLFAGSETMPSNEEKMMMVGLSSEDESESSSSSNMNPDKKLACLLAGVL